MHCFIPLYQLVSQHHFLMTSNVNVSQITAAIEKAVGRLRRLVNSYTIISNDGDSFVLEREAAELSGTLRDWFRGNAPRERNNQIGLSTGFLYNSKKNDLYRLFMHLK